MEGLGPVPPPEVSGIPHTVRGAEGGAAVEVDVTVAGVGVTLTGAPAQAPGRATATEVAGLTQGHATADPGLLGPGPARGLPPPLETGRIPRIASGRSYKTRSEPPCRRSWVRAQLPADHIRMTLRFNPERSP